MPQRHRDAYPPEFKSKLVALVLAGRTPEELAREFAPSNVTIRTWVKQSQLDSGSRKDGLTSDDQAEMARARKRVKQLELEREILSKAASGSHGKTRIFRSGLRIRESVPGPISDRDDVPSSGGFH